MKFKIFENTAEQSSDSPNGKDYILPVLVGLFMLSIVGVILCKDGVICPNAPSPELDAVTLCPINKQEIKAQRNILLDFSDPLTEMEREQVVRLVQSSTQALGTYESISLSILQNNINAPRVEAANFCNPIDKEQIADEVGRSVAVNPQNCNKILGGDYSWPKRVSPETRKNIGQACRNIKTMEEKIQDLIAEIPDYKGKGQSKSYIIRGIEDIIFQNRRMPGETPKYLTIFSDMLQNAEWFSQYRTKFPNWTIENLKTARRNAAYILGEEPQNNVHHVRICYVQRKGVLSLYAHQNQHRKMWADYFKSSRIVEEREYTACADEEKP